MGVGRGGEHGGDGHHKDYGGSRDQRHLGDCSCLAVLLAGTGRPPPIKTTGCSGCPSLSLDLGDQDEKERARRRSAFPRLGGAGGRRPDLYCPYIPAWWNANRHARREGTDGQTDSFLARLVTWGVSDLFFGPPYFISSLKMEYDVLVIKILFFIYL